MNGVSILWLLFNTKIGRIILGILIGYIVVVIMGWWLIPIILVIIAIFVLADSYERLRFHKSLLKDAEKKQKLSILQDQKKKEAFHQHMKDYPKAVGDVSFDDSKRRYDLYWLRIGKGGPGNDIFENKYFKIAFGIAKDYSGLIVSITNNCDKEILVDWRSFVINDSRVHIDGVVYVKYPDNTPLAPNETETRLLQSHNLFWGGKFKELFDPKEMNRADKTYYVTFNITDGDGEVRTFVFKPMTQHKCFKFTSKNNDEVSILSNAIGNIKKQLKTGYFLIALALFIALGIVCYNNRYKFYVAEKPHIEYTVPEKVLDQKTDTINTPLSTPNMKSSHHQDNMRGFDPASEDDMDDNGMQRYFDANDEEAWD